MADRSTISASQLCAITGLTDRQHRNIAKAGYFPPPMRGVYHHREATLFGIIKYQRELLQKKSDTLRKEQEAHIKAKREMAQEDLAIKRGLYVEKSTIGPALRNLSMHQRAVLQRKLEHELGPNLVGLTTLEIMARMRAVVDELCSIFYEGSKSWLETEAPQ